MMSNNFIFQGIRNLDSELVKLVEAKEDKTKIYKVYLKIGHISLLAKDFPRGIFIMFVIWIIK